MHEGRFSRMLVNRTRPRKLHLIDPWLCLEDERYLRSHYGARHSDQAVMDARYARVLDRFAEEIRSSSVEVHRSFSQDAVAAFPDDYFDFIYLDGDHHYEAVVADLDAYFPKVQSGGLIIGDDYSDERWWGDAVIRAFHEFIYSRPVLIEVKIEHQIALRKL